MFFLQAFTVGIVAVFIISVAVFWCSFFDYVTFSFKDITCGSIFHRVLAIVWYFLSFVFLLTLVYAFGVLILYLYYLVFGGGVFALYLS